MPWEIREEDGQHCVYKIDGGRVKCYPTKGEATGKMRALYASEKVKAEDMPDSIEGHREQDTSILGRVQAFLDYLKSVPETDRETREVQHTPGLMFKKDASGRWWWFGVTSNNRLDKEEEIITTNAHRYFERALDDGTYEKVMGQRYPEFWYWHIPVAIGEAHNVAYDERGFFTAWGPQKEGPLYDHIFERLAKAGRENPGMFAMSHGAPGFTVQRNPENHNLIESYLDKEITILPRQRAANDGTIAGVMNLEKGDLPMRVEERKREHFVEIFGQETLEQFDNLLSHMSEAADAAGIPKKEMKMTDTTDKDVEREETVAESEAAEETTTTDSAETQEINVETEEAAEEEVDEEGSEKEYVTVDDLNAALKEAAEGIGEGLAPVLAQIKELSDRIEKVNERLDSQEKSDEQKLAQKAADTPRASFAALFAESIVGSEEAQVDYHKERKLHQSQPDEAEDTHKEVMTGVSHIDEMIRKQQGRQRVVPGYASNGQQ